MHVCVGQTTTLGDGAGGGLWGITPTTTATIGSSSGEVTGIAAGMAAVTYSLGSGCVKTAIVTVNGIPAAITGAGCGSGSYMERCNTRRCVEQR